MPVSAICPTMMSGSSLGNLAFTSAAIPAATGAAIDVPDHMA
jgi:hypothetical protein